ncbi:MAG: HAD family hydrolase [Clostridia bacterium]|nr:HAD family hydrolase [Clostridia bacterium]
MIKCCIFDLDGTLLNTLDTITYYVNVTLKNHNIEPITLDECKSFVGSGARNLIRRALASRGISDESLTDAYLGEYKSYYDSDPYYLTEPYPKIYELLDALKARGIRLAVLSNKQQTATSLAVEHFFGDRFDAVLGDGGDMPLKPEPDSAFYIMQKLGVTPSECAYIGDSDVDALTGINAGASLNISVLWGFRTEEELTRAGGRLFAASAKQIFNIIFKEKEL